jgi:hypothetical protein
MTNNENQLTIPKFKNRKVWLVVFGILQIILGAFCMHIAITMATSGDILKNAGTNLPDSIRILTCMLYLGLAIWFILMGIGSIKARRWARVLILITSWVWLIVGLSILFYEIAWMPDVYNGMVESGKTTPEAAKVAKYLTIGFSSIFMVIMPSIFVLFYSGKNVKATCEFRDQNIRWTDKCPLPVLILSLWNGFAGATMFLSLFSGYSFPFFGFILKGVPALVVILALVLSYLYLAWGTYKLKIKAWWGTVALTFIISISVTINYLSGTFMKIMNDQPNQPGGNAFVQGTGIVIFTGVTTVLLLGYLVYIRKFFLKAEKITSSKM